MANIKTATLSFRVDPELKEALRTAAVREHRSVANMVEVLIRDYCKRNDIIIQEFGDVLTNEEDN
ncbi:ribbon-helix-helix protein, CopG family [Legionella sp. 29fVS95]|uniref:ribbon-helix-helix protein, CopG family n=1 Tax=Legionella sp. 29fVS95 TaxID=3402813 RepID=UPI003AF8B24B